MSFLSEDYLYWRLRPRSPGPVHKSDGFEGHAGLKAVICNERSPCRSVVTLYARMGLHRYNLLQGKNYQLSRVEKYNHTLNFGSFNSYYITSVAMDPDDGSPQYFQTRIDEQTRGVLLLTCYIAVPQGDPKTYPKGCEQPLLLGDARRLPEWPPENPFQDTKRFYVVKNSELQDNANGWIRLYLELAVATNRRTFSNDEDLSNLEIVKVAMETTQGPNEGLNTKNATFYISYRDPSKARVGKDIDRIAVVRRSFDEQRGCFTLAGQNQSSETIPKEAESQSAQLLSEEGKDVDRIAMVRRSFAEQTGCFSLAGHNQAKSQSAQLLFSRRVGLFKPWRLSSPRRQLLFSRSVCIFKPWRLSSPRRQLLFSRNVGVFKPWRLSSPGRRKPAYRNRGVGFARSLHKTRSI